MSEASEVLQKALARSAAREKRLREAPRPDYAALNKMVKRQRARLTRAKNSGDPGKVILACRDAVREWDQPGAMWPDDWALWQSALDDVLPYHRSLDLVDLA
jgi:hypothetical protein